MDESLFLVSNASRSLKSVLFKHFLFFIFLSGNVPILHDAKSDSFSIDRFHGLGAVAQDSLLISSSVSCVIVDKDFDHRQCTKAQGKPALSSKESAFK